ncbi:MAG: aldehyde dehydrogenase family protein, partial [Deltaproteobacteria bacterium]|nr:aldehyde dehydrogenase family protein [Deltaproteobacteria bacterium]
MSMAQLVLGLAQEARSAARELAKLDTATKNQALLAMSDMLLENAAEIQAENKKDVDAAQRNGLSAAMIDRLLLSDQVMESMAEGLRDVAALPDPVGEVTGMWTRPNRLQVGRVRIPLGVIGFIYESRPNVTADAAGLCLKSGNAVILKGGSEAINSNLAIASVVGRALEQSGAPRAAIQVIPTTD